MNTPEPQPTEPKPGRRRFQYTLGTLMAFVTAFAMVCSYSKIVGSDGVLELGTWITAFIAVWIVVLLLAMFLYLPCRVGLWLMTRARNVRPVDRRPPANNTPPQSPPPAGSTSGPPVE